MCAACSWGVSPYHALSLQAAARHEYAYSRPRIATVRCPTLPPASRRVRPTRCVGRVQFSIISRIAGPFPSSRSDRQCLRPQPLCHAVGFALSCGVAGQRMGVSGVMSIRARPTGIVASSPAQPITASLAQRGLRRSRQQRRVGLEQSWYGLGRVKARTVSRGERRAAAATEISVRASLEPTGLRLAVYLTKQISPVQHPARISLPGAISVLHGAPGGLAKQKLDGAAIHLQNLAGCSGRPLAAYPPCQEPP